MPDIIRPRRYLWLVAALVVALLAAAGVAGVYLTAGLGRADIPPAAPPP